MRKLLLLTVAFAVGLLAGCKSAPNGPGKAGISLPFGAAIVPSGVTIDGGGFSTLSGKDISSSVGSIKAMSTEAALSYTSWPGAITIKVDGNTLASYQQDVASSSPLGSHEWVVDSNSADGVPQIDHTIRSVPSFEISGLANGDTVSRSNFTIHWSTTSDTATYIMIVVSRIPQLSDTSNYVDTSGYALIQPNDVGSYTFSSSDLAGIPSGGRARIGIVRFVRDVESYGGHNYIFFNGYQDNVACTIN